MVEYCLKAIVGELGWHENALRVHLIPRDHFIRVAIHGVAIIDRWFPSLADGDPRLEDLVKAWNSSELSLPSRSRSNFVNALLSLVAKGFDPLTAVMTFSIVSRSTGQDSHAANRIYSVGCARLCDGVSL